MKFLADMGISMTTVQALRSAGDCLANRVRKTRAIVSNKLVEGSGMGGSGE